MAGRFKQDCPVCLEDMQTARQGVSLLRCGHAMHRNCFMQYMETQIGCPLCKKSMVDPKLFEEHYDTQLALMEMPEDYKNTFMVVACNDC